MKHTFLKGLSQRSASRIMTAVVVGSVMGGSLMPVMFPVTASAATTPTDVPTVINMMGQSSIEADHVVANDPWSNAPTSFVPVYYLERVLKSVGVQAAWNGDTLNITSTPTSWTVNQATAPYTTPPPAGQMQFAIGGNSNGFVRSPKLVAKDPASGVNTTYVPVYYANLFLHKYLSMGAVWTGQAWTMSPQPVIVKTSYSDNAAAAAKVQTIQRGNTYLGFGPQSQTVSLGLGITAKEDGGLGHAGLQWQEGNWTVEVLWLGGNNGGEQLAKNVVSYLHTHMLPAPKNAGVIIISSMNWSSSTLVPSSTIAWQEGNVVNELQTLEPPLQALQKVVSSNQ